MRRDMYYVIRVIGGEQYVVPMSKKELLKIVSNELSEDNFLGEIDEYYSTNHWDEDDVAIIKGKIITPRDLSVTGDKLFLILVGFMLTFFCFYMFY
jgi:hypothetical protein